MTLLSDIIRRGVYISKVTLNPRSGGWSSRISLGGTQRPWSTPCLSATYQCPICRSDRRFFFTVATLPPQ
ncbi:uncharacterized protein ARMOST_13894 [Armillaria ostoyae]|uniref:Uncharacterized protein n=1 Tax=Armillaria ostoyae TaxID=47428 RepID=A0A284RP40_ARMOS|nr:uncharacterized protein ARMOST_13894 [Armillaria ostoyae]